MSFGPLLGCRRANALYPSDSWDLSYFMDLLASNRHSNFMENNRQSNAMENTNIQVDWKETPVAHFIKADIPGLTKEDVKIQVEEGKRVLEISGELPKKELDENESYLYLERPQGSFSRRFKLPDNAEIDEMKAKMEKGVLTLIIPKTPGRERRIKSIQISD